jgi:hypothetical protein
MADGYYIPGIYEEHIDFFTFNYAGKLWRLGYRWACWAWRPFSARSHMRSQTTSAAAPPL